MKIHPGHPPIAAPAAILALAIVHFGAAFAAAQAPARSPSPATAAWTAEDILLAESASGWEISPDGKRAVWVRSRMDKDKNGRIANLVLTDLETRKEIALTRGTETSGAPKWSPNGEAIAFLSSKPLPKPNPEQARSQLWLMSWFISTLTCSSRDQRPLR